MFKQDRQCTYNVTLRLLRASIVVVEKQWVLHNRSVFVALGIQHAMRMRHIVMRGLPPSTTFFHNISRHDFRGGGGGYWTQNVFWFSLRLLSQTFLILRRNERDIKKNVYWSSHKAPVNSCPILTKREFCRQIFEKSSNIKFHENPSSGSRVVPCGRKDGQIWQS
jgi:hypothetical protein